MRYTAAEQNAHLQCICITHLAMDARHAMANETMALLVPVPHRSARFSANLCLLLLALGRRAERTARQDERFVCIWKVVFRAGVVLCYGDGRLCAECAAPNDAHTLHGLCRMC